MGPDSAPADVYEFRITLLDVEPTVWRLVAVPAASTLAGLHSVIQRAMGWQDMHLHQFETEDGIRYESGNPAGFGAPAVDARTVKLPEVFFEPAVRVGYEYDFGDSWRHVVQLIASGPGDPEKQYPVCLDGERACPPEDCGGQPGYEELLEVLGDPEHEDHEGFLDRVGGDFDPERFDIDQVNVALRRLRGD